MSTVRLGSISTIASIAVFTACGGAPPANGAGTDTSAGSAAGIATQPADCTPLETRSANGSDQRPARPDQTRACGVKSNVVFDVTVVTKGLVNPWAVEPLPGGDLLVTEKPGRLRIVSASGTMGQPIAGLPAVDARG